MNRKLYIVASILMVFAMLSVNLPGFSTQTKAATNDFPNILINEVDADNTGTDIAEFVELFDGGTGSTPLDGLVLVFYNGNADTSYEAFDLDGYTTDAQGYFVLCTKTTNVPNCDYDGSAVSDLIQNGADAIALYAGNAADFPYGTAVTTTNLVDAIVYDTNDADDDGLLVLLNAGQPQVNEDGKGAKDTQSNQRCPNGSGGARNTDTFDQFNPTPGEENTCVVPVVIGACGDPATPIHDIQGSGSTSPEVGKTHVVEGVVVGDFQDSSTGLGGFFLQEEDTDVDTDPLTSEGIFVYDNGFGVDVNSGEVVRALGTVSEYYDLTELGSITGVEVCPEAYGTATASQITLPVSNVSDWEPYEDMLVTIPGSLTVSQNYFQGRYGQVTLSADGRMYNPTNGNGLGDTFEYDQRRMLILDDGNNAQNPNPIPYIGEDNTLRAGDTVMNLTGVIDYGRINSSYPPGTFYRLQPIVSPVFTRVNQRTSAPAPVGDNVKIASFNVLNYFNGDGQGGGFPTSRGANTLEEFDRQRTKIITAVVSLDADVVGLMEIENDSDDAVSAIQDLVNGLNEATAPGTDDFVSEPGPGTDEIKVAMIYKPGIVTPVGASMNYQVYDDPVYGTLFDRPPLAQTFQLNSNNEMFTVVVNHFKSKSSCPDSGPDADQGDGQGCWNAKRVAQASGLLDFISDLQASSGDPDVVVIGDLNSYGIEDPINTLTSGGLVNEIASHVEAQDRYTYVFDGLAGYLDQGLATASVDPQVTGVTLWHINTDEPSVIDYNTEYKPQDLYTPTPYRSSDHDPVLLGLNLTAPELSITKSVTPTIGVPPGGVVTYTIELDNNGDGFAPNVILTDTLPAEVAFGDWITQNGATEADGEITWRGDVAAGESQTLVFTATVDDDPELYNQTIANAVGFTSENSGSGSDSASFIMEKRILMPTIYKMYTP